ncbi:WD40-repeat-containing domain protein [Gongronella butleri]|nr:WD40-repeat-containing domain protein [Gongronella butleri]
MDGRSMVLEEEEDDEDDGRERCRIKHVPLTSSARPMSLCIDQNDEFDEYAMQTDPLDSPNSALPSPVSDVDDWNQQDDASLTPMHPNPAIVAHPPSTAGTASSSNSSSNSSSSSSSNDMVVDTPITTHAATSSFSQIPPAPITPVRALIDTYDALPNDIQDYLMLHLLRRTPMQSLRFASDVIMQVLRTDFVAKLPRHLSQKILLYLDVRTLCRASAVSRLWHQFIDADAWLWRVKIMEAAFVVSPHELIDYPHYLPPQFQQNSQNMQTQPPNPPNQPSNANEIPSSSSSSVCSEILSPALSPMEEMLQDGVLPDPMAWLLQDNNHHHHHQASTPLPMAPLPRSSSSSLSLPPLAAATSAAVPQVTTSEPIVVLDAQQPFKAVYRRHHQMRVNWKHNRAQRTQVKGHGEVVTCLQFDNDKIITGFEKTSSGYYDNSINIYDIKTGQLRRKLHGHEGGVWALQYVGNTLVTGSTDRTLRIWDIERGICRYVFCGHTSTVRCLYIVMPTPVQTPHGVVMQPDQPKIISGSRDCTIRVWNLPYLPAKGFPPSSSSASSSAAATPNASASSSSSHHPPHTHHHHHPPHHHHRTPSFSKQDPGDEYARNNTTTTTTTSSSSNPTQAYHTTFSQEHEFNPFFVHLLRGHTDSVRTLAAHGNMLVSGSYDNTVRVWDLEKGERLHQLEGHTQKVYSVVIDPKNNRCISGSMDSTIRIWCLESGRCLHVLRGHTSLVGLLGLTDAYLVSAAADASLRVWSTQSGDCHHVLSGHHGHKTAITSFQHDNIKVVSGSEGGLKMWDVKTGELMHDLITDVHGVWRVAFDERRCVAAVKSETGTRLDILDYGADLN